MAKQVTIFGFSLVITDLLMYQHIHRHKTLSKKSYIDDGIHQNIVSSLFSVHNILSLSLFLSLSYNGTNKQNS